MIRTLIVDDETKSREILREILTTYFPEAEIIGEAGNITEAHAIILKEEPNVVLLDIFMPGGSGFDLLNQIEDISFEVIFVTAYDEYAIQAVKSCALDYLLKPVSIMELKQAMTTAAEKINNKTKNHQLEVLKENINGGHTNRKIAIPDKDGLRFVPIQQIIRMEADGSYTVIFMENNVRFVSTRHLKEYETLLPDSVFFRAHHSHLVNLEHIHQYQRGEGGTLVMSDNSAIHLSKRKKKSFMELFKL